MCVYLYVYLSCFFPGLLFVIKQPVGYVRLLYCLCVRCV